LGVQASPYRGYEPSSYSRHQKDKGRHKRLTAQKRKEIKEAFDLFDTDGSGVYIYIYIYMPT
jgi:calcium-binding protein CML